MDLTWDEYVIYVEGLLAADTRLHRLFRPDDDEPKEADDVL